MKNAARTASGVPSAQLSSPSAATEIVLLAVSGMSPAVITETVWALAHQTPPIIPDRVVAITTRAGRAAIEHELFESGVWEALRRRLEGLGARLGPRLRFGTTASDIRVFTRVDSRGRSVELEDIRTPEDNEAVADSLLDQLRSFTENPDVRLICSLAGGRKTMGALLYACLSLIGRETDRVTHVLVNEPFDDPRLTPKFYFPTRPATRHQRTDSGGRIRTISSDRARIELADVPFIPLRQLFPRELGCMPGRFMGLVSRYRSMVGELAQPPRVEICDDEPVVRVEGRPVRLPLMSYVVLMFLVERARRGEPAFGKYLEAIDPLKEFAQQLRQRLPNPFDFRHDALRAILRWDEQDTQELRKAVTLLRDALERAGISPHWIRQLVPQRGCFGVRVRC